MGERYIPDELIAEILEYDPDLIRRSQMVSSDIARLMSKKDVQTLCSRPVTEEELKMAVRKIKESFTILSCSNRLYEFKYDPYTDVYRQTNWGFEYGDFSFSTGPDSVTDTINDISEIKVCALDLRLLRAIFETRLGCIKIDPDYVDLKIQEIIRQRDNEPDLTKRYQYVLMEAMMELRPKMALGKEYTRYLAFPGNCEDYYIYRTPELLKMLRR